MWVELGLAAALGGLAAPFQDQVASDALPQAKPPTQTSETLPAPNPALSLDPHPLADCVKEKKRRLSCPEMTTKAGFIINTNLRDKGRTIQYQISAFGSARANAEFAEGFEERVREHFRKAVPIAAEIMGWDPADPETVAMIEDAHAALDRLVVSLDDKERVDDGSLLASTGLSKEHFSAGSFYSNRSSISNSYTLYVWQPGFTKKQI